MLGPGKFFKILNSEEVSKLGWGEGASTCLINFLNLKCVNRLGIGESNLSDRLQTSFLILNELKPIN